MDPAGDSACRPDRVRDRLGFLVPDVGDQDLGALRGQSLGRRPANAVGAPGETKLPATCPLPQVTIIVILPMAERFVQSAGTVLEFVLASRFDNWPGIHTIQSWQRLQL
jgi:hypothetical protein